MSQGYWILFAQHGLKKLKILQSMSELINAFATQRFCRDNFFLNIIHKELKISPCVKLH